MPTKSPAETHCILDKAAYKLIHQAIRADDSDLLYELLPLVSKKKQSLNFKGSLLWCYQNKRKKSAHVLVHAQLGLNVYINNHSPLSVLVINDEASLVKALLKAGAHSHFCNQQGETLLHLGVRYASLKLFKTIVATLHRDHIDAKTTDGQQTALHQACQQQLWDKARLLIQARADLYMIDKKQRSPLSYAAQYSPAEALNLLAAYDAVKPRRSRYYYHKYPDR